MPNSLNTYILNIYEKEDLVLNNLQWLICHKTKPNQTKPNHIYLIYMYKEDMALNNQQGLNCQIKQNKIKQNCSQISIHLTIF